ncbi:MAG: hypothetical protein ABI193_15865 [Minicystis sp.]
MITTPLLRLALRRAPLLILASAVLAGCSSPLRSSPTSGAVSAGGGGSSGTDAVGSGGSGGDGIFPDDPSQPPCTPTLTVKAGGPALLVNDPAVLAHFPMERVLKQLLDRSGPSELTPLTVLQRLFDAENTGEGGVFSDVTHCDTFDNAAFKNAPADGCPRAEGALAASAGLLTPGDSDFFAPVALVNRFDLTPQNLQSCGEYRIVYAKWSGRSDPGNRVFVIFEGSLPNPLAGNINGCRPVAAHWASLEKMSSAAEIAAALEAFYFDGLPGIAPIVDPGSFGALSQDDDPYGASHGQLRVSQRMQEPWEMREYHFLSPLLGKVSGPPRFEPVTVKNNPLGSLFGATGPGQPELFQSVFVDQVVQDLAAPKLTGIRMAIPNVFNTGESALESAAAPDYLASLGEGGASFTTMIDQRLATIDVVKSCDPQDPLDAKAIVARATTQTCAGCHAPRAFLGEERKIGCGLVWPDSLNGAHIDEKGALSPALTDVFLPRRASVLGTYLQACDLPQIMANLQPVPASGIPD